MAHLSPVCVVGGSERHLFWRQRGEAAAAKVALRILGNNSVDEVAHGRARPAGAVGLANKLVRRKIEARQQMIAAHIMVGRKTQTRKTIAKRNDPFQR